MSLTLYPIRCARLLLAGVMLVAGAACSSWDEEPVTPTEPVASKAEHDGSLQSGKPIWAHQTGGLTPLCLPKATSGAVVGAAHITSAQYPDLFYVVGSGAGTAYGGSVGLHHIPFSRLTEDGTPVYGDPIAITEAPWTLDSRMVHITEILGEVYAVNISQAMFRLAKYDPVKHSFGTSWTVNKRMAEQIPHSVTALDAVWNRSKSTLEVVFLQRELDSDAYTLDMEDVSEGYYDSMGIYRAELPYVGLYSVSFYTSGWTQATSLRRISQNDRAMLIGQGLTYIKGGQAEGYVVGNKLGTLKWQPVTVGAPIDYLLEEGGALLTNRSVMSSICSVDGDGDGREDDFFTSGEGMIYLYTNGGRVDEQGVPIYQPGRPVLMEHGPIYPGSLSVPSVVDWDGDGVHDIVAGNSEGRLIFYKNYGSDREPSFGPYEFLTSNGEEICFRSGYYEVQGPLEAAWGYLCPIVVDWNGDGLLDVVFSGTDGNYEYMLNEGTATAPRLGKRQVLELDGLQLHGAWRCRPAVATVEGKTCILIQDEENALHLYEKQTDRVVKDRGQLLLTDGSKITTHRAEAETTLGERGRAKLNLVDWDDDGDLDLLIGTIRKASVPYPAYGLPWFRTPKNMGLQVMLLENVGSDHEMRFALPKLFQINGRDEVLGGHSQAPAPCPLGDMSAGMNLLVGCESGNFYYIHRSDLTTTTLW